MYIFIFKNNKIKIENKDEILEKINSSKKNIKKIKRLKFKLMDLEDLIT